MPTAHHAGLTADLLQAKFAQGKTYADYVATGNDNQRDAWQAIYDQTSLTDGQRQLLAGFARRMHLLVTSGVWCGDCVQQVPLIERIAEASEHIETRYFDRDEHADLAELVQINAGMRVPMLILAAEDFEPVSVFGDRTLTRYRALAAKQLGASCPVPGAPLDGDELNATLQDWLDEIERVQLLLRLSTRLRQKHGD
jgi:hypothetical protein